MEIDHNPISEDIKGKTAFEVLCGYAGGITFVNLVVAIAEYYEPDIQHVMDIPQAKLLLESVGGITGVLAALNLNTTDTI